MLEDLFSPPTWRPVNNAPVNGNSHPGETWGIRQLKGKKEEKAPPYGGNFLVEAPTKGLDFSRFVNIP